MSAKKYAQKVKESFTLPEVCRQIRGMLDDPNAGAEDIANLISLDPSLCSKLLKLANSALFRFPSQISSISKAINIIGGEALYILVMSETAANAYQHFENDALDIKRFWKQSVLCGLIAKRLCKECRVRGSEQFFLMGLLNNFAELVVATQSPKAASFCEQENEKYFPWELQKGKLGFYYADCSGEILKLWQLPEQLYSPLFDLHNAQKATESREIAVMYLAYRLALSATLPEQFKGRNVIQGIVMDAMGLLYDDLESVVHQSEMEAREMLHLLNPNLF